MPCLKGGKGPFPFERGRHLEVSGILYTFGDESGIEDAAEWCILAGYVGEPRQWERFRREWRRVLRKYRVPEFHAKDFYQPERRKHVPHYADWPDERPSSFLAALLTVINERNIDPIAVSLPDGKTMVFTEDFKSSGAPSRPYMAIFQRFVGEALLKAEEGTSVHFTFDTQNVMQARAIETFQEQFKGSYLPAGLRKLGERAASIRYADSVSEEPLQAADLCAYFWNRASNDAVRGRLLRQTAEAFAVKPHRMSQFNREHLQRILDSTLDDAIKQINRVQKALGR